MAAKRDKNHALIVYCLQCLGWCVFDCSRFGWGYPDLTVARAGVLRLVEIKDGALPPSERPLTPAEQRFHNLMAAGGVTVAIVTSVEDARALR